MKKVSSSHHIKWHPPRPITFDGFVASNHSVASGFVIHDKLGSPLLAGFKNISHSSILVVEAKVVKDALCSALEKNFSRIQMGGDFKLVIDCINKKCLIPWCLKSIIKDILSIASKFKPISF